jgi:RimJ/RimL family protein N-acetyltransferase
VPELRLLRPGDEAALEAFLSRHADTSMFLRANAKSAGLVDQGQPLQATYAAAMEGGAIAGVAAHCWNGMVLVQAPSHAPELAQAAMRHSGRAITGFSGPWSQVVAARAALGLARASAIKDSRDELYALDLERLVVPPQLTSGALRCRRPEPAELEQLIEWRVAFSVEALGAADGPDLRRASRADVLLLHDRAVDWVLVDGKTPVAYSAFNASLPDIVQVGGVWTPLQFRGRGYARSVVAGSLLAARQHGAQRAVLFVDPGNAAARAAYLALGFRMVGNYGLVLLAP